jgi:hypothetical protein
MKIIGSLRRVPAIGVPLLFFAVAATANVIDFNTLTGANGDPFTTYSEDGFTATATQGSWSKAFDFGNPVPDIFCNQCAPGTVTISEGGALFTFADVDLGDAKSSVDPFTIQGFLLGSMVFSQPGEVTEPDAFQTFASTNSAALIDTLTISLTSSASSFDYNIDNIVVNPAAPEPGTAVLFLIALAVSMPFWGRVRRIL